MTPRFSLRSLLLGIAVAALVLASWRGYYTLIARPQQIAARLAALNAYVNLQQQPIAEYLPAIQEHAIRGVDLSSVPNQAIREALDLVAECADIEWLNCSDRMIRDSDLAKLRHLPKLTQIDLGHTLITAAGLRQLAASCPRLEQVDVWQRKSTAKQWRQSHVCHTWCGSTCPVAKSMTMPCGHCDRIRTSATSY